MKILVLGAGGIGGYFGGRLAQSRADVTFLVRPKRLEQLRTTGLVIESPSGNAKIKVATVLAEELKPEYDFVFFTCKSYDLDSAMEAVAPAMRGECALIPMLNGMSHMQRLDARFGPANVMGGLAQINVTLRPNGTVLHMEALARIVFGERSNIATPRAQAFADACAKANFDSKLSPGIELEMWEKVVFLSALAATTCLLRGNVAEIMASAEGAAIMNRAIAANIAIATKAGFPPRAQAIEFATRRLTTPGPQSASMLRDLEAGGQVEADHIVGFMLDLARKHGVDDGVLAFAIAHLKAYEARRAAGRLPATRPPSD